MLRPTLAQKVVWLQSFDTMCGVVINIAPWVWIWTFKFVSCSSKWACLFKVFSVKPLPCSNSVISKKLQCHQLKQSRHYTASFQVGFLVFSFAQRSSQASRAQCGCKSLSAFHVWSKLAVSLILSPDSDSFMLQVESIEEKKEEEKLRVLQTFSSRQNASGFELTGWLVNSFHGLVHFHTRRTEEKVAILLLCSGSFLDFSYLPLVLPPFSTFSFVSSQCFVSGFSVSE